MPMTDEKIVQMLDMTADNLKKTGIIAPPCSASDYAALRLALDINKAIWRAKYLKSSGADVLADIEA